MTITQSPAGTIADTDGAARDTDVSPGQQGARLLNQVAGYVAHRTIAMGLRTGLIDALAARAGGLSAAELAAATGLDNQYVPVWCRAALATGLCDIAGGEADSGREAAGRDGDGDGRAEAAERFRLAAHLGPLLLDTAHPAYLGGIFGVLEQPEVFTGFERGLLDGRRMWWSDCRPEWIEGVAGTGLPFYTRLIPGGLERVAGLTSRLDEGCLVVDSACGSGAGLVRLAVSYPRCRIVGVDGDEYSLAQAARRVAEAGVGARCRLVHSALEDLSLDEPVALIVNNISMHECRDIDRAAARMASALEPGGHLVISDFPFPDTVAGLRTAAGQVMSGIQFFEAQIDDQLLPRRAYPDLLQRHGFAEVGQFDLAGVHTVTHGRTPTG